jgi:hypothetical protein
VNLKGKQVKKDDDLIFAQLMAFGSAPPKFALLGYHFPPVKIHKLLVVAHIPPYNPTRFN